METMFSIDLRQQRVSVRFVRVLVRLETNGLPPTQQSLTNISVRRLAPHGLRHACQRN